MFKRKNLVPITITVQIGTRPAATTPEKNATAMTDLQQLKAMGDTHEMYGAAFDLAQARGYDEVDWVLLRDVRVSEAKPYIVGFKAWGTGYDDLGYDILGQGKTRAKAYIDALRQIYKWEK